jgi:LysM repeat protein
MVQESESPSLYVMKRKESLKDIAAERNLSLQELMEINNINVETGIAPGSIIRLSR